MLIIQFKFKLPGLSNQFDQMNQKSPPKAMEINLSNRKRNPIDNLLKTYDTENNQDLSSNQTLLQNQYKYRSLEARKQLALQYCQGTYHPHIFLYRDQELQQLNQFFIKSLDQQDAKNGKIIMITGSAGCGKTLTINASLKLRNQKIVRMNGNTIKPLKQLISLIIRQVLPEISCCQQKTIGDLINLLEQKRLIIVIEQIEQLFKNLDDTKDFFSLFFSNKLKIALIGTSNTINTLDRYIKTNPLEKQLVKNLVFRPYTAQMIKDIIKHKIQIIYQETKLKIYYPENLLSYSTKKLENMKKGDIRFTLKFIKNIFDQLLCDISLLQYQYKVTIHIVNNALAKMIEAKENIINCLPLNQQIVLLGLYQNIKRTGSIQVTIKELTQDVKWVCKSVLVQYNDEILNVNRLVELQTYSFITKRVKNGQEKIMLKLNKNYIELYFRYHPIFKKLFQQINQQFGQLS